MSNRYKILIIEDEENIIDLVKNILKTNGYDCLDAKNANDGFMMFTSHNPDLVILDLGLPDKDGMYVLEEIRKTNSQPVIVLSARHDESDKVEALDKGANDYVTKPFGSGELVARVRSALRNYNINSQNSNNLITGTFKKDDLVIDYNLRRVFIEQNEIKLTHTEYNIIALLSRHLGKVLTYSFIIKEIWGYNDEGSTKKLQVNMANIRKKFGDRPGKKNYIQNELGIGYFIE